MMLMYEFPRLTSYRWNRFILIILILIRAVNTLGALSLNTLSTLSTLIRVQQFYSILFPASWTQFDITDERMNRPNEPITPSFASLFHPRKWRQVHSWCRFKTPLKWICWGINHILNRRAVSGVGTWSSPWQIVEKLWSSHCPTFWRGSNSTQPS